MPRFAANLSMMFNEVEFLERFAAAAKAGFAAVEYLSPYEVPAARVAETLKANNLAQALFNLPAGNWAKGERGIGCHPDRVTEFREGVAKAIEYATALGCKQVNCLAGIAPAGADRGKLRETLVANLRYAAPRLADVGVRLVMEPINTRDIPGFFVTRSSEGLAILDEAASPNLWLQYDVYHMQIMEGDLARTIAANLKRISHIQVADNPGRHEPGTGEINFGFLFAELDRIGYEGWVGAEYRPAAETTAGLSWFTPFRRQN